MNASSTVFYTLILMLLITVSCREQDRTAPFSAMTYNIRYDNPGDGPDRWDARKDFLAKQVLLHEPVFLGIQEGLLHQVHYLDSALPTWKYVGVGRDDGKEKGEFSALYYDTTRAKLVESGTFWLSETPGQVSTGWDAALPRICTWGKFELGRKKELLVMNTHFDHVGEKARVESGRLILQKSGELNPGDIPVVIMGDLNLTPDTAPIAVFSEQLQDSHIAADLVFGPPGTWNGFDFSASLERRIDYIFLDPRLTVSKSAILSDHRNGHYPSDHLPVYAEFE